MGKISDFFNDNRGVSIAIVAGILIVALAVTLVSIGGKPTPTPSPEEVTFFDETTNQLVKVSAAEIPPIKNDVGHTLVRAHTDPADSGKIRYLERFTDAGKAEMVLKLTGAPEHLKAGLMRSGSDPNARLVRRPEAGSPWTSATTPEGLAITK